MVRLGGAGRKWGKELLGSGTEEAVAAGIHEFVEGAAAAAGPDFQWRGEMEISGDGPSIRSVRMYVHLLEYEYYWLVGHVRMHTSLYAY
jgi:hypothetical protein